MVALLERHRDAERRLDARAWSLGAMGWAPHSKRPPRARPETYFPSLAPPRPSAETLARKLELVFGSGATQQE